MIALAPPTPQPTADVPAGTPSPTLDDDPERLGDEIARLAAHLHAATYRLLVLIRRFDERDGWSGGFRSCAHWLSWRIGLGLGAAREHVRVARALEGLPRISAAMQRGELSYSKVRALTRVATAECEPELLEFARAGSASHVERLVRAWRRVDRAEEADAERERHLRRSLELYPDTDGSWVLRGRLTPEVGAALARALDVAARELHGTSTDASAAQKRADAIGRLAEAKLADVPAGTSARPEVVLHVEAVDGHGVLEGSGWRVPEQTSRRLACDAGLVVMRQTREGGSRLEVGRRRRTVPSAIRRALEARDGGCRFPGCGLRRTDAHHVRHWADGGETTLDNLVLLCRRHHRAVHEDGFGVEVDAAGRATFIRPDGRPIPHAPALPAAPTEPVAALERAHAAQGIRMDAYTPTAVSHEQRLDLDWAVSVLWRPAAAGPPRPA